MEISEQELRAMVRDAIARQSGQRFPEPVGAVSSGGHASHARFPLVSGDAEGRCVIEPTVRCNHCGYCLSMGH